MTKPALTLKSVKTTPLTQNELDTNFTNLRDATFTLTADTGGTSVVSDLNGVITLVAGAGMSITGNNTTKTITLTASGLGGSNSVEIGGEDTSDVVFAPPSGYEAKDAVFTTDGFTLGSQVGANVITGDSDSLTLKVRAAAYASSAWTDNEGTDDGASITIDNDNILIEVTNDLDIDGEATINSQFVLANLTSTEIGNLTARTGAVVFNTTTSKFQGYDGTNWVDLN